MDDSSMLSISYLGSLERVSRDKCACILLSCYMSLDNQKLAE